MTDSTRIQLESFHLEGLPFYHDQKFDLSYKGISLILGLNLDSSAKDSNAAGKSLFFSELAETITHEPLIGVRGDVIRKGSRTFELKKRGHHYKVVRSFSPREKIVIYKDGKDLEFKDLAPAKAYLFKLLPYTSAEVKSLFYIDSRTPHPLIRGDTAQRRDFFRRFFHMDAAPTMRKIVKAELDKIVISEGALTEVSARLKELKARVADRNPEVLIAAQAKAELQVKKLTRLAAQYVEARRVYDDFQEHKPMLRALKEDGVTSADDLAKRTRVLEKKLDELAIDIERWDRYDESASARAQYKLDKANLVAKINPVYLEDPEGKQAVLKARRKRLKLQDQELERQRDEETRKMRKYTREKIQDARDELKRLDSDYTKLQKNKGKCPTCGQKIADHGDTSERLAELASMISATMEYLEIAPAKFAAFEKAMAEINAEQEEVTEKLEKTDVQVSLLQEFLELKAVPNMEKPTEHSREILEVQQKVAKDERRRYAGAEAAFLARDKYAELVEDDRELAKGEDPTDRLMEANQFLGKVKGELLEAESLAKELSKLRARHTELKELLSERPVLELLQQAMSKGGVESLMIQAICERLKNLVNKYASMIFPEELYFDFELEPQFSFLVTRKYGKRTETSDVRKLSGAQSLLFGLVLYVALMSFIPASKRLNVLILDEPTANFGPDMVDAFIRFLPTLNSIVDHIIVITPMPQQPYPGAKVWTVAKKNGVSQIFEGQGITLEKVNAARSRRTTATKSVGSKTGGKRDRV